MYYKTDSYIQDIITRVYRFNWLVCLAILYIMKRYIIHLKNQNYIPRHVNWLLNRSRNIVSDIGVIVHDTRVATERIEFDTSVLRKKGVM